MWTRWTRIAALATILTASVPVFAESQSSQTKSETYTWNGEFVSHDATAMTIAALKALCSRISWCDPTVLESSLELALEIAREGREGRRIGTLFTVGKADPVLAASRALILDPLVGQVRNREG